MRSTYSRVLFILLLLATIPVSSFSQTKEELEKKITDRTRDIDALIVEIGKYEKEISALNDTADTLSSTIKTLDLTQKKLAADISLTENRIEAKNLEIQQLGTEIADKGEKIDDDHRVILSSFSAMYESKDADIATLLLSGSTISEMLEDIGTLSTLQGRIVDRIKNLRVVKSDLESNKRASEKAKADLVTLRVQLGDQRKIVLSNQSEKNKLLNETKQSESQYKKLLATKKAQKEQFEKDIYNYEAQIKKIIDLAKLPHTGSGVLSWPLAQVQITQYFGYTDFATANPQVYKGAGHNGVDFRASVGTTIKAALSGTVVGVGNTDLWPGCYSYGKWVLVKHPNGLSTLYAHLSLQTVATGQNVVTGQMIGYSGNTGYTTGPHLHFGVYASEGVEIRPVVSKTACNGATIPLAGFNAYLNPLSYL